MVTIEKENQLIDVILDTNKFMFNNNFQSFVAKQELCFQRNPKLRLHQ